ncbi:MAG: FdrA family protein, partial [Candidatus Riflebacteria bacterium]|nr:FdrA family protein [Candidatus Riflebacteria bacterium]
MNAHLIVRKDSYQDSVLLMRISRELKSTKGVADAVVAMGTPVNRELLKSAGYAGPALDDAGPNDLIIAVRSDDPDARAIEEAVNGLLSARRASAGAELGAPTLAAAIHAHPRTNVVLISVP